METSETTGAISTALAKAHLEIENPELDGINPHFKSRFSTLAAVLNAVRKPLAKQGIALMQSVAIAESRVCVTTSLHHSSGEWMRETMSFPIPANSNVQQAGSCVTYLRRYSLIALCAIVGDPHEDDDGEADNEHRVEQKRQQARPEPTRTPAPRPVETAPRMIGEWLEIVPKYIDEGVAGKNQSPYVKIKTASGENYFVWDVALHGVAKASKNSTIWVITEESKKAGGPPRIVQISTAEPTDTEGASDDIEE